MEIQANQVSPYLLELIKLNHINYLLDEQGRKTKLEKIHSRIKEIKELVYKLPREEKDKTDKKFLTDFCIPVFGLAYYGLGVREIIADIIEIYRETFKTYIEEWNAKCHNYIRCSGSPIKVLFVSERLNRFSSVLRDRGQIIQSLCQYPELYIDVLTNPLEKTVEHIFKDCKNVLTFRSFERNLDFILGGRYDIVVFPDLHMDTKTSGLSLFRLAPIMITTFGHSETSGTCDYFITSKLYETNYQDNYLEKVIPLKSLNMKYSHIWKGQEKIQPLCYYNLPSNKHLYLCSSSPFKFGLETLEIFKGILERDPEAYIVLTRLAPTYDNPLYEALEKIIGNVDRIKFLPRQSIIDLMSLNSQVDCVLDPYPFGNLNTTLECFEVGTPVITWPTNKANGRFTAGFYEKIGLMDYVVNSKEEYIVKAIEVASQSKEQKEQKRETLKTLSEILFNELDSVNDWKEFLINF